MDWGNDDSLHLIDVYEQHPVLWNPQNGAYYNRRKKHGAWINIAGIFGCSPLVVKKKMESLLGSFRREKAKGTKIIGTGDEKREVYVSRWFAFDRMAFLLNKDDSKKPFYPVDMFDDDEDDEHSEHDDSEQTSEDCNTYGEHLANKLRHYSKRTKNIVHYHINNILFQADMGQFEDAFQPITMFEESSASTPSRSPRPPSVSSANILTTSQTCFQETISYTSPNSSCRPHHPLTNLSLGSTEPQRHFAESRQQSVQNISQNVGSCGNLPSTTGFQTS